MQHLNFLVSLGMIAVAVSAGLLIGRTIRRSGNISVRDRIWIYLSIVVTHGIMIALLTRLIRVSV